MKILLTLLALAPAWAERNLETPEDRRARLEVVAEVLKPASSKARAAVVAIAQDESKFARYVLFDCAYIPHEASGDCDKGLARGYWQLQRKACPALFKVPSGSREAVEAGAKCAWSNWLFHLKRCGSEELAFSAYGGSGCVLTEHGTRKYKSYLYLRGRL